MMHAVFWPLATQGYSFQDSLSLIRGKTMELSNLLPPIFGVFGLVAAAYTYAQVKKHPEGEGKVVEIGNQIHLGAMVFMKREYKMLSMFAAVLLVLLYIFLGAGTAICFLMGSVASGAAGYIGMNTATRANVRTTTRPRRTSTVHVCDEDPRFCA